MTISSGERPAAPHDPDRATENAYRDRWKWDDVVQSSHAVDCYPTVGACPYQVYMKDGEIRFQEQAAKFPIVEEGLPDFNPMGCQKGACWDQMRTGSSLLRWRLTFTDVPLTLNAGAQAWYRS